MAQINPLLALSGKAPHLIDEWQKSPDLWNHVRASIDKQGEFGLYLLTGSASPLETDKIHHSGAGRITVIDMSTLTLHETGEGSGLVSLSALFEGTQDDVLDANAAQTLEKTVYQMCRGGWPNSLSDDWELSLDRTKAYCASLYTLAHLEDQNRRRLDVDVLKAITRSYARNVSTEASVCLIGDDVRKSENLRLTDESLAQHLSYLRESFVLSDISPWSPNLRSKATIRTTSTRHFCDVSVAIASSGLKPAHLLRDPRTLGLLFEDFAVHELRVYANQIDGVVKHYRDKYGSEVDAVIELEDGRVGLCEIKLGGPDLIASGVDNLNRLYQSLEDPSIVAFRMVITAFGPCMKSGDVWIVPINALKD